MSEKVIDDLIRKKTRKFYGRDFDTMRADLLRYASIYFSDQIRDFSDPSVGGLFLDMAAHVGDVMSFYLDHQFGELDINTAVETKNIEKLLNTAGVKMRSAAPAVVYVSFFIEVPTVKDTITNSDIPDENTLPIIQSGTILESNSGIKFELMEDVDFSEKISDEYTSDVSLVDADADADPPTAVFKKLGICVSGNTKTKKIAAGNFEQFKKITLDDQNINEIISIKDTDGNEYYEVEYLSQDVVFKEVQNKDYDYDVVSNNLELLPAPYRFIKNLSRVSGLTTITFGSGNASSLDGDYIPDPSEFALPLYGKTVFPKISIDPNNMLNTSTLGMSPHNTTLQIVYRHGGGLNNNVKAGTITALRTLNIQYNKNSDVVTNINIKNSLEIENEEEAKGGEDKPTLNQMRYEYKGHVNSQSRIVTKKDLLSRIYSMPSNFGRIFRAGITKNSSNPLATQLYIISRDKSGTLTKSSDTLIKNIEIYLNQYRLISDSIDILDAFVINVGFEYDIVTDGIINPSIAASQINNNIKSYFNIKQWQIDQPINLSHLQNLVLNSTGVVAVNSIKIVSKSGDGTSDNYSSFTFDVESNTHSQFIVGPVGSIFELKFPDTDIIGYVS
jgi:hypothetical protein